MININKIKELRLDKKLTQEELGNALGLAKNTISQYETGERTPSVKVFKDMAAFFGVTVNDLIYDDDNLTDESTA